MQVQKRRTKNAVEPCENVENRSYFIYHEMEPVLPRVTDKFRRQTNRTCKGQINSEDLGYIWQLSRLNNYIIRWM